MPDLTRIHATNLGVSDTSKLSKLQEFSALELAQALAERLTITDATWHRLKSNRKARAGEQAAVALLYLLKDQPEEAIARFNQAQGWLNRSISAPPCATHGNTDKQSSEKQGKD